MNIPLSYLSVAHSSVACLNRTQMPLTDDFMSVTSCKIRAIAIRTRILGQDILFLSYILRIISLGLCISSRSQKVVQNVESHSRRDAKWFILGYQANNTRRGIGQNESQVPYGHLWSTMSTQLHAADRRRRRALINRRIDSW